MVQNVRVTCRALTDRVRSLKGLDEELLFSVSEYHLLKDCGEGRRDYSGPMMMMMVRETEIERLTDFGGRRDRTCWCIRMWDEGESELTQSFS